MSRFTMFKCDRCYTEGRLVSLDSLVVLVMSIPDGHITRTDVWKEEPAGKVDLCKDCATSYRYWWSSNEQKDGGQGPVAANAKVTES